MSIQFPHKWGSHRVPLGSITLTFPTKPRLIPRHSSNLDLELCISKLSIESSRQHFHPLKTPQWHPNSSLQLPRSADPLNPRCDVSVDRSSRALSTHRLRSSRHAIFPPTATNRPKPSHFLSTANPPPSSRSMATRYPHPTET